MDLCYYRFMLIIRMLPLYVIFFGLKAGIFHLWWAPLLCEGTHQGGTSSSSLLSLGEHGLSANGEGYKIRYHS